MKHLLRCMLCAVLAAGLMCVPAFAAQESAPERQGDFYVLVNGEYATFTDAVPQIRNNRSCLPFAAVFEQLGFPSDGMSWDQSTKTVTAVKDGLTLSLTIGQPVITLTDGEGRREITADTAPYVDPDTNRTYVPFGLVADALGYRVGWDSSMRAVIIDDVDAILAKNTATYDLMDQYLAYAQTFSQGSQEILGKYAMEMDIASSLENKPLEISFDLNGDYTALSAGAAQMQFKTEMAMAMKAALDGEEISEATEALGELPESIDMELRGDWSSGVLYIQSAALAEMMGQPGMAGSWYKLDLAGMFDSLGMEYSALMELALGVTEETSFQAYLSQLLALVPLTSVDATTTDTLTVLNDILADAAFQQSGDSYVNTIMDEDGIQCVLTLHAKDGAVNGCALKMTAEDASFGKLQMGYDLTDSKMTMELGMDLSLDELGTAAFSITMDGTYTPTDKVPEVEPPAGAAVVDLSGILDAPGVLPSAA